MLATRVGYAGGSKADPTYRALGNHAEAVEVVYDPSILGYEKLIAATLADHNPCRPSGSGQYRSIFFYQTGEEKRAAETALAEAGKARGQRVYTAVEPLGTFYPAEDYHQKYYLRGKKRLFTSIAQIYPDAVQLRDSTLAARANAYAGGHLTSREFRLFVTGFPLPLPEKEAVIEAAGHP